MASDPEAERARNAAKQRAYRARKKAEKEAAAAASAGNAGDASHVCTDMQDAVTDALAHMKWLKDSDGASVAQAKHLAEQVDRYCGAGNDAKMLSAHGRLSRVLHDLGGTPTVRMQHELRSSRGARKTEGSDGSDESTESPQGTHGNVSKFQRPPKRKRA